MHWLTHHLELLEQAAGRLLRSELSSATAGLHEIFAELEQSERLMIRLLNGQQPAEAEPGTLDFGPVLHLIDSWLSKEHPKAYAALRALGLPESTIEPGDFARWERELETCGVVAGDGTLFGTPSVARFAQFDPGWPASAAEYMLAAAGLCGPRVPFPHGHPRVLSVRDLAAVRIAIAGDWGSGGWGDDPWGTNDHGRLAPALLVRDQIMTQQPDVTIHLGDVYYGGTEVEETEFLTSLWPAGRRASFTLNSNHEMFLGGRGYFERALDPAGIFAAQQQTSYFAVESDDWAVLGLDSAYADRSAGFMDGALTDPYQIEFVRAFAQKKHLIVLTHHNALNTAGTAFVANPKSGSLWTNLISALNGRPPDFWYWGHLHNGIVYKSVPWDARTGPAPSTRCRCVGHSALPFGRAYYLDRQRDNVDYVAETGLADPVLPAQSLRVKNGWVLLTIGADGLREEFWETGDSEPAWQLAHSW